MRFKLHSKTESFLNPLFTELSVSDTLMSESQRRAWRLAVVGPQQAKVLEDIEEQVGNLETMPNGANFPIQDILLSIGSLNYVQRFVLLTFLPMNQCLPVLVAEFLALRGKLRDQAAVDHCLSICNQIDKGTLKPYKTKVMAEKEWMLVSRTKAKGDDWQAACRVLRPIRHAYTN